MSTAELVDHLFRHEAGRIVAGLTARFGLRGIDLAEDIVQETFLKALKAWSYHGPPDNPSAWLWKTAVNAAIDRTRHAKTVRTSHDEIAATTSEFHQPDDPAFSREISDDVLKLLFACCDLEFAPPIQVTIALKFVGGLSVTEIARGLLTGNDAIRQRITRAKRAWKQSAQPFTFPNGGELTARRNSVLTALYVMFTEGYACHIGDSAIRRDLTDEALRLAVLMAEHEHLSSGEVDAVVALFAFQAARLPARLGPDGELRLLAEQNRQLWNQQLIDLGFRAMQRSQRGDRVTRYHLEAAIASTHTMAESYDQTDWAAIVAYYDSLLSLHDEPIVRVNRAVACAKSGQLEIACAELDQLKDEPSLASYPWYHAAVGEVAARRQQRGTAISSYERARDLTDNTAEQRLLTRRLAEL